MYVTRTKTMIDNVYNVCNMDFKNVCLRSHKYFYIYTILFIKNVGFIHVKLLK